MLPMPSPTAEPRPERPILVVMTMTKILRLVRMYLEREGYAVREASDGQAALAAIAPQHDPALVVLDLMLPEIDGLSVLRAIRRRSRTPVIISRRGARSATGSRVWSQVRTITSRSRSRPPNYSCGSNAS